MWSPLLQKRRYVSNHMMHVTDFLPTLLSVAGSDFLQTIIEFTARETTILQITILAQNEIDSL